MTTIAAELGAYHTLRQRHVEQIEAQLAQLQVQIAQQLQDLQTQEHLMITAQRSAIAALRPVLQADARCLLDVPLFEAVITPWMADSSRLRDGAPDLSANLADWISHTLPFPVQIVNRQKR